MTALAGAVLTGDEILDRSSALIPKGERLIEGIQEDNLKGAAYDLRMADDGMVLPNGDVILPNAKERYGSSILLTPGQTVFVSTLERINMPQDLTGNMSIKGELASHGVLSLTGLIVDPGYKEGGSGDGRLHFRLANLGSRPVLLQPRVTKIASIQFLRLGQNTTRPVGPSFRDIWDRTAELREGLGFIEDSRRLEQRVVDLETQLAQQGRTVQFVLVAALFVVVATLLGTGIAAFLSLGSNSQIVQTARSILPHNTGLKILFVIGIFGVATVAWAIASGIGVRRARPGLQPSPVESMRVEAVQLLRARRARAASLWSVAVAIVVILLVAASTNGPLSWYVAAILGLFIVGLGLFFRRPKLWWPITRWDVDAEIKRWEEEAAKRQG